MTVHALGIDLEDWYLDVAGAPAAPPAVAARALERQLAALVDLLRAADTRCTFFVLGRTAARYPDWIRALHGAGHEIGCHGHEHRRVEALAVADLAADVARARDAIGAIIGAAPVGYRAPYFSLAGHPRAADAYEALAGLGVRYSSSRADGGRPRRVATPAGLVVEIPATAWRVGGRALRVAGGGWWRLLPWPVIRAAIAACGARDQAFAAYLHPHEFDPLPLAAAGGRWRSLRANLGRRSVPDKLRRALAQAPFGTYRAVAEAIP